MNSMMVILAGGKDTSMDILCQVGSKPALLSSEVANPQPQKSNRTMVIA